LVIVVVAFAVVAADSDSVVVERRADEVDE
jgi:hypothetical protein